jgi:hypothetical protein
LENMLRGSSDIGAMSDQAYGLRKDMLLYQNGAGPMEIDMVNIKDREQIGGLTALRLAASHKNQGECLPVSYINEIGNFKVVNNSESNKRELENLVRIIESDRNLPAKDLAQQTGLTEYRVKHKLGTLGWHRVQGGEGGASPWHQDNGKPCPFAKPKKHEAKPSKPGIKEAVDYLQKELAGTSPDGEYVSEADIFKGADEQGLSDNLVAKAKRRLGVVVGKNKEWSLPGEQEASATEATVN